MIHGLIVMGLGPLGLQVLRRAQAKGIRIAAGVDIRADLQGKSLSEFVPDVEGLVYNRIDQAVQATDADTVIITTVSSLTGIISQLEECCALGINVVSSCEELVYPWDTDALEAERIDRFAQQHHAAVVATGVNPGFLMDLLPATLAGACVSVESIRVERYQNAATRRLPFRNKIGAGLDLSVFEQRIKSGTLRHVGLRQSVAMIAASLGWQLSDYSESCVPIVAQSDVELPDMLIKKGQASGVEQLGDGWVDGKKLITLHFRAAVAEQPCYDRIVITGEPSLDSTISGGVHGDIATAAILLNAASVIDRCESGLKTMLDLPVMGCRYSGL